MDQQLNRLLENLEQNGELDRTVVIVTSDHGESLGEHQEATHGMFIYNSTMRVPLVFSCPALFQGPHRCRDRVVGLIDLRATIEDLLGVGPTDQLEGQSLLGEISPDRLLYLETEGPLNMTGASPCAGCRSATANTSRPPFPSSTTSKTIPTNGRICMRRGLRRCVRWRPG